METNIAKVCPPESGMVLVSREDMDAIMHDISYIKNMLGDRLEYCSREETGQMLGVTMPTLRNMEKREELIPTRIGVKVLYKRSDVVDLMHKKTRRR